MSVQLSRRQFLGASAALGAVGVVGLAGSVASAADPWEQLTADQLAGHVGESYRFVTDADSVTLVLQVVAGLGGQPPRPLAFAALFKGPAPDTFGGEVGRLSGPGLAKVEVLMNGSPAGTWELIRNSEVPR